jgi:hypothetical protein
VKSTRSIDFVTISASRPLGMVDIQLCEREPSDFQPSTILRTKRCPAFSCRFQNEEQFGNWPGFRCGNRWSKLLLLHPSQLPWLLSPCWFRPWPRCMAPKQICRPYFRHPFELAPSNQGIQVQEQNARVWSIRRSVVSWSDAFSGFVVGLCPRRFHCFKWTSLTETFDSLENIIELSSPSYAGALNDSEDRHII